MKTPVLFLSLFLLFEVGFAQSIYFDAIELRKLNPSTDAAGFVQFDMGNSTSANLILGKYIKGDVTPLEIRNQFNGNPFLRAFNNTSLSILTGVTPDKLKSIGNLPVTTFADGLARFMVKRMKEELSVMFFDQFQRELEKQKDLQLLFPSTYAILETAKSEIYSYQKFLPALREAFAYDMDEILENTYKWSTSDGEDEQFPILKELRQKQQLHNSLKAALYLGNELDNGHHPGDVITNLKSEDKIELKQIFIDFPAYLEVLDIFSQSLRSNSSDRYWIGKQEISSFQDDTFFRIYLGLVFQTTLKREAENPQRFRSGKVFSEILRDHQAEIQNINNFVVSIAKEIVQTEDRVTFITLNESKVKTSDYFNLLGNIFKLTKLTINSPIIKDDNKPNLTTEKIEFYLNQSSFLYANIKSKAYPAAVFNTYAILSKSMESNSSSTEAANRGLEQFLKYGTFIATVATSESSEEVAHAIEAVALPPGSARIKREAAWNISLNSYLGGFLGNENITFSSKNKTNNSGLVAGIFAPVGLSFSRNFSVISQKRVCNFSASMFASIIDIGALASFRLNSANDTISTLPEIKLENIISPGLYGIIGLPRIPVSIGAGYQVGPVLREVSVDNLTIGSKSNRFSIFIAVDIPLVNFWTRSRERIPVKKSSR